VFVWISIRKTQLSYRDIKIIFTLMHNLPFAVPHLPGEFLQLSTLSIGIFNLIQLLEAISVCKKCLY